MESNVATRVDVMVVLASFSVLPQEMTYSDRSRSQFLLRPLVPEPRKQGCQGRGELRGPLILVPLSFQLFLLLCFHFHFAGGLWRAHATCIGQPANPPFERDLRCAMAMVVPFLPFFCMFLFLILPNPLAALAQGKGESVLQLAGCWWFHPTPPAKASLHVCFLCRFL